MKHDVTYIEFAGYDELAQHPQVLDSLIRNYCRIFSEPEVWNEHYEYEEMRHKLRHELAGCAGMRLCLDRPGGEVIGFFWGQLLHAHEIVKAMQTVHFFQEHTTKEVRHQLLQLVGEEPVIFVQDLGVSREHRGTIPLEELICPALERLSHRAGTRRLFFWSVQDTCIAWLAQKVGIDVSMRLGRMQFFLGEYPSPQEMAALIRLQQQHRG